MYSFVCDLLIHSFSPLPWLPPHSGFQDKKQLFLMCTLTTDRLFRRMPRECITILLQQSCIIKIQYNWRFHSVDETLLSRIFMIVWWIKSYKLKFMWINHYAKDYTNYSKLHGFCLIWYQSKTRSENLKIKLEYLDHKLLW